MNDYYNDPPDSPEPPEWYSCIEQVLDDHIIPESASKAIRQALEDWADSENQKSYPDEPNYAEPDWQNHYAIPLQSCRHGGNGQCDHCDHESDLAYDAAREKF